MLLETSTQVDFQFLKCPKNGETGTQCHQLYCMVYGQQHFQGVWVIPSGDFLEVFGPTQALTRGMKPIEKYYLVCTNYSLRQNRDRGLSFVDFALVITHNINLA